MTSLRFNYSARDRSRRLHAPGQRQRTADLPARRRRRRPRSFGPRVERPQRCTLHANTPNGIRGRQRLRAVVARYVNRVWARSARSRALGAGSRAECRHTVMQRATVARTGKIEREGRGPARAPASIPAPAPPQRRPAARNSHYDTDATRLWT